MKEHLEIVDYTEAWMQRLRQKFEKNFDVPIKISRTYVHGDYINRYKYPQNNWLRGPLLCIQILVEHPKLSTRYELLCIGEHIDEGISLLHPDGSAYEGTPDGVAEAFHLDKEDLALLQEIWKAWPNLLRESGEELYGPGAIYELGLMKFRGFKHFIFKPYQYVDLKPRIFKLLQDKYKQNKSVAASLDNLRTELNLPPYWSDTLYSDMSILSRQTEPILSLGESGSEVFVHTIVCDWLLKSDFETYWAVHQPDAGMSKYDKMIRGTTG